MTSFKTNDSHTTSLKASGQTVIRVFFTPIIINFIYNLFLGLCNNRNYHELPKQELPKQELPKQELPKQELLKQELPKQELPKQELPKQELP